MFDQGTNGILISQVMVRYEEDNGLVKKKIFNKMLTNSVNYKISQ